MQKVICGRSTFLWKTAGTFLTQGIHEIAKQMPALGAVQTGHKRRKMLYRDSVVGGLDFQIAKALQAGVGIHVQKLIHNIPRGHLLLLVKVGGHFCRI